ncbi:MAG: VWA domain-containing protein [Planctomycetota bacterium]|nr:VWA domain-containing protein [Planctomycetota bacterium]
MGHALMQQLKRAIEAYLGIEPSKPGESTAWSIEHHSPWATSMPEWAFLMLAVAFVATIALVYKKDAAKSSFKLRAVLLMLRFSAVAVILCCLARPILQIDRTDLPYIVVLIDDSLSMTLPDEYPANVDTTIRGWLDGSRNSNVTRFDVARAILTAKDGDFLKQLLQYHKLRVYRFSESANVIGSDQCLSHEDLARVIEQLHDLRARGKDTRLQPAVKSVLDDFSGTPPTAIVVLTDGVASISASERLSAAIPIARRRLVPIYAIGIGSDEPTRDLQLYDLMVDEVAIVDVPLIFSAKLKSTGFATQPVRVTLSKKDAPADVLAEVTVKAPADGNPLEVELSFTPTDEGKFEFVLEAVPLAGEANRGNNRDSREVTIRKGKIRVLLVDYEPRYEFRYLKHLLARETKDRQTIEVKTLLQEQPKSLGADAVELGTFPETKDDLFEFDVVVFGDVDRTKLTNRHLEHLRDFVREKGGGVIFVAGPRFNPVVYRNSPLEEMFPVVLESVKLPEVEASITTGFRPELTAEGRRGTPMFRFAENQDDSNRVWNELQEMYWMLDAPELVPGATVLAQHPTRKGKSGNLPVIALRRFGAGKVLFHATDELWRWRFRVGDVYFGRYWLQAIRYLSRSKLIGKDRSAVLYSDREKYEAGDDATIRIQFFKDSLVPAEDDGVAVTVERTGDVPRSLTLSRVPGSFTIFEGRLSQLAEGRYDVWVTKPAFEKSPPVTDFKVEAPSRELKQRDLDKPDLMRATKQTYGRYFSVADAMDLPDSIPSGQPVSLGTQKSVPLWNRWELLTVFGMLLLAEWLLRKRARLS